ncbi:MAG: hypothetical protein Q8K34_05390 [Hydrogenophaga sp.]|jgi:non-ribosomal peptide synthetase component F|uniref:hypothetical protein n=1 Tax=Hydrogenophaga sp. TaxID=1904254 RepID=UPI002727ED8D|nr:hypothetical protein [Hydrogenophaga sp.]MDO9199935.1 hypothetical protein [Hydrogenophaga sp.]MDO9482859.1 hypothetical protein [Hydrogenophaga sp.]MDO9571130.1 hypothetical protein [Hydrogenophaga sp.]MDP1892950.1 hypothetical protein [Hydrogenophaga sp.]MDP2093660.1 hypothetical protein [Hydrogenophaga sp.]
MTYTLKLFVSDDTSPAQRQGAERLFREALETTLGDPALVAPVYAAYQRIAALHGEAPDVDALTVDERMLFEHWQLAEAAALSAVWGPYRSLDEGTYEIVLPG